MTATIDDISRMKHTAKNLSKSKQLWLLERFASGERLSGLIEELIEDGSISQADLDRLAAARGAPTKTSRTSSKPPSSDQKSNRNPDRRSGREKKSTRSSGGQPGHPGSHRQRSDNPDSFEYSWPSECANCNHGFDTSAQDDVSGEHSPRVNWLGRVAGEFETIELVARPFVVIRQYQMKVKCNKCGCSTKGPLPSGGSGSPFGPNLQTLIVVLKMCHHFSYQRTKIFLKELGCEISEGAIANVIKRAGERAAVLCKDIEADLKKRRVLHGDETGVRVRAKSVYQFVIRSACEVRHIIAESRSRDVILAVLEEVVPPVWVSDRYSAQQGIGKRQQTCLAHLDRKGELVLEQGDPVLGMKLTDWIGDAYDLADRMPDYKPSTVKAKRRELGNRMAELVATETSCQITRTALTSFRNAHYDDQLLTFADFPPGMVPTTNNDSERSLRHSVIMRKVIYCFRSWWGAKSFADIRSVLETAALKGKTNFQAVRILFPQ